MVALLLAPFSIALAVLALALARGLGRPERRVLAVASLLFAAGAVLAPQVPGHDAFTHFTHLRAALADPVWLLDRWDRPGFTLLYAAPAALGLTAARLASVLVAAVALAATMRTAQALGLPRPWLAGALLAAHHDFFGQASSTMTELPFAAALAIAALGFVSGRPGWVAGGLGWMGITRPEGPLFAALGALVLLAGRRPRAAALALAPFGLYVAASAWASGGLGAWLASDPYGGLVAPRLELAQLWRSYFFVALAGGQPPVLLVAEVAGAALALSAGAPRLRFALAPLAVSYLLLTFLRIGPIDAWRETRYLVAVAPALALLAAAGLEAILAAAPRLAPPGLLALAAVGAARPLRWHWHSAGLEAAWLGPALHLALLALAALLLLAARRRPQVALAALLAVALAAFPPGALARHRPESLRASPAAADGPAPPAPVAPARAR